MTRTFTEDANAIVVQAYEHAIRLGHPYLGGEHLLLALAAAGQPAGAVLRKGGVTPGAPLSPSASRISHWASSPSARG
jgi:ATP-dependent Clp protease ATP-binding subunit ClpA